jgi:hypothetical protein
MFIRPALLCSVFWRDEGPKWFLWGPVEARFVFYSPCVCSPLQFAHPLTFKTQCSRMSNVFPETDVELSILELSTV